MRAQRPDQASPSAGRLHGCTVVITRPAGTGQALARRLRALGAVPILLPGLTLQGIPINPALRRALRDALRDDLLLFSSPAAVRYAAALAPLRTRANVIAVGQGTARALRQHGIPQPWVPQRQDSEGVLALPELQLLHGQRISLIGADGGRGLLREQLVARGAQLRELHVYRRVAPRLDRRHFEAALRLPIRASVLLSSAEALQNLRALLPPPAWQSLTAAIAVVSSARLEQAAREAGFTRTLLAASAGAADLIAAIKPASSRNGC